MDAVTYAFVASAYDHHAKRENQYQLFYHMSRNGMGSELEVMDSKGRSVRKKHKTPLQLDQFMLGSSVNIPGYNFTLLQHLDEKTKEALGRRHEG